MRVEFVRQLMAESRAACSGSARSRNPSFVRSDCRWPDEAREIVKQRARLRRERPVRPQHRRSVRPRDLYPGAGRAAAIARPGRGRCRRRKSSQAGSTVLPLQEELTDRELWAMVEMVGVFGERLDPAAIEPAQDRLRREISASVHDGSLQPAYSGDRSRHRDHEPESHQRGAPASGPLPGSSARAGYRFMVGQSDPARHDGAACQRSIPSQASEAVRAIPPAIAMAAVAKSDQDSAYLLALIQVVETLARTGDPAAVAAFGQALAAQLALPNQPRQRAALARAAVPLLESRNADSASALCLHGRSRDPPPGASARRPRPARRVASADAEGALRQALAARDDAQTERAVRRGAAAPAQPRLEREAARRMLNRTRTAAPHRCVSWQLLAPSLTEKEADDSPPRICCDLLPRTKDYLTREAIARALRGPGRQSCRTASAKRRWRPPRSRSPRLVLPKKRPHGPAR